MVDSKDITEEELAEAYKKNADNAKKTSEEWFFVSLEANKYLSDSKQDEE